MTPGVCQNFRSAPQKHPSANSATSLPSGYGGTSGVPSTSCAAGTLICPARPRNACSGATIRVLLVPKSPTTLSFPRSPTAFERPRLFPPGDEIRRQQRFTAAVTHIGATLDLSGGANRLSSGHADDT